MKFLAPRRVVQMLLKRHQCSTGFISNADAEFTAKVPISHTPIFSQVLMSLFAKPEHIGKHFQLLDMTFGTGSHTCYILDQFRRAGVQGTITVYASDCDPESHNLAKKVISERSYDRKTLIPIKSSFKDLESHLQELNVGAGTLSGILIDTGINAMQWANKNRGFCHLRDGIIDLRLDPTQNTPKGYDVLQNIDEAGLQRLLKKYGSLNKHAKYVTNAILEARYMNYELKTVHELHEILDKISEGKAEMKTTQLLSATLTALRAFVNDELNQLDFAITYLAAKYLKPQGCLAVIAHTQAEEKVVFNCLKSVAIDMPQTDKMLSSEELEKVKQKNPWTIIYGEPPKQLPMAEQILYPRLKDSVLFVATRN